MPTREQLYQRWESERIFGTTYGNDDGYNVRGSSMAGIGLRRRKKKFSGECIGTISVDPITKDLIITPLEKEEERVLDAFKKDLLNNNTDEK